jgi:hypothetical protein
MARALVPEGPTSVRQVLALPQLRDCVHLGGDQAAERLVVRVAPMPERRESSGEYRDAVIVLDGKLLADDDYLVDLALRWMAEEQAALLIVVSPVRPVSLSPRRLADKLGIGLVEVSGSLLEVLDRVREAVEAPNRLLAATLLDLAGQLDRLTPAQGVWGVITTIDSVLGTTSALVGPDGQVMVGPELDPPISAKDLRSGPITEQQPDWFRLSWPIQLDPDSARFWLVSQLASPTLGAQQAVRRAAQLAANHISVRIAADRLHHERESRAALSVLESIASLSDVADPTLLRQIAMLGWRVDGYCAAVNIRLAGKVDPTAVMSWTDSLAASMEEAGLAGPLVERPDGWTWWQTSSVHRSRSEVDKLSASLTDVLRELQESRPDLRVYGGIGCAYPQLDGLRKSLAEAADAATIAQATGKELAVRYYGELGIQRLMVGWLAAPEFVDFARTLLRPVLEADQADDLLRTLEVYLDCESSATATAEMLGLHRNTIVRRVARLRQALSAELDDPDERLALQLACRVINLHT